MQKYVALGPLRAAHPGDEVNEHIWYAAPEADELLASKDRDLQEAAHNALMLEASAAAFQRVAEQRQAEIERLQRGLEWCLENGAKRTDEDGIHRVCTISGWPVKLEIPADLTDIIIKPTTGASNG